MIAKSYFERINRITFSRMKKVIALLHTRLEVVYAFWVAPYKGMKEKCIQKRAVRMLKELKLLTRLKELRIFNLGKKNHKSKGKEEGRAGHNYK